MTSSEQQALSERVATLAEAAGLPKELLWEPAETCPQGHSNRDIECGDIELTIGDLCRECWTEEWRNPRLEMCETDAEIDAVVDEEMAAYPLFNDPAFYPEWRIGRVAKDLTDLTSLLAVVEAWRQQKPLRSWSIDSQVDYATQPIPTLPYAVIGNERNEDFETDGETPWEALALAFAEALEREKGVN